MVTFNSVYPKRGLPFQIADYPPETQKLIRSKLLPVEEVIAQLPRRFRFYSTFAMSQGRGLLRKMSMRKDWERVRYYGGMSLEPYPFFRDPHFEVVSAYFSPLDRLLAEQMGKSVPHLPRQFIQFGETMAREGFLDYVVHTVGAPDADGYVNLGLNCEILHAAFEQFARTRGCKIILEINSHVPWVPGHPEHGGNKLHLSNVHAIYENHERVFQLPRIVATEVEATLADRVLPFIEDGDTLQLGIGGIPNYIAEHLNERRQLKIHSEMIADAVVDLHQAGAIDSSGKEYMDGYVVGTFAAGTDKLYDWLDRNPEVVLLPIRHTNHHELIGKNRRMKSINSGLMVDLHGQVYSDAVGFTQISGVGGQLEFVMGAQRSEGGRSILCVKSTSRVKGRLISNIVLYPPRGTPVTVPRQASDTIVTEHGSVELRDLDGVERAEALVGVAHPAFRDELMRQAKRAGIWGRRPGFRTFAQRAMYNNLGYVRKLKAKMEAEPKNKGRILMNELMTAMRTPKRLERLNAFYSQNRE